MEGNFIYCETPAGRMGIAEKRGFITRLFFEAESPEKEGYTLNETPVLQEAMRQLAEYFAGTRKIFSLPLNPEGTPFMKSVWNALLDIPYGQTRSYGDIARSVGNEKACRAVGLANNKNPIPIIIPCHRVIGAKGQLVGYGGGLSVKSFLLEHEKQHGVY